MRPARATGRGSSRSSAAETDTHPRRRYPSPPPRASACAHRFPQPGTPYVSPARERRACSRVVSLRVTGWSPLRPTRRRPLIRSSTHAPDQPILRLQLLHWTERSRRCAPCHSPRRADFHHVSRVEASNLVSTCESRFTALGLTASTLPASSARRRSVWQTRLVRPP